MRTKKILAMAMAASLAATSVFTGGIGGSIGEVYASSGEESATLSPVVSIDFSDENDVVLHGTAALIEDPDIESDNSRGKVLRVNAGAGGGDNGNYAVYSGDMTNNDFSEGVTISMDLRPTQNSGDWNYIFAIGQNGDTDGKWNYVDGTIGFIVRKGDTYVANFPGDSWVEGNVFGGSSTVNPFDAFVKDKTFTDKWYTFTWV